MIRAISRYWPDAAFGKVLVCFLMYAWIGYQQTAKAADRIEIKSIERPLFWKIIKAGKTSYLLGTIHVGVQLDELPDNVIQKLVTSERLALEADIAELFSSPISTSQMEVAFRSSPLLSKETSALKSKLSPVAWKKLVGMLGLPEERVDKFSVSEALVKVSQIKTKDTFGTFKPMTSAPVLDAQLKAAAEARKVAVAYLETFSDLNTEVTKILNDPKVLEKTLLSEVKSKKVASLADVEVIYRSGKIEEFADVPLTVIPELNDYMLGGRNKKWINEITKLHHGHQQVFFAVGAAHLAPGKNSLLSLLEKSGFKVTRLQ